MLKQFYISVNRNMRKVVIGFIAVVIAAAAVLPANIIGENLLSAWGVLLAFSLFMALGDHVLGWWDDVKDLFD